MDKMFFNIGANEILLPLFLIAAIAPLSILLFKKITTKEKILLLILSYIFPLIGLALSYLYIGLSKPKRLAV